MITSSKSSAVAEEKILAETTSMRATPYAPARKKTNGTATSNTATDVPSLLSLVDNLQQELGDLKQQRQHLFEKHHQLNEQIKLAGQVQREQLPDPGAFRSLEVRTLYHPAHRVSGDVYDITRLDEDNVGISLADASGHGVSSALLTMLLKRSFRGKEVADDACRMLEPTDVLNRVNHDVLTSNFKQCQFVTGLYGVYYEPARTFTFARGGSPYPILLRTGRSPRQLVCDGPILGAFGDAVFDTMTVYLEPGDAMILYTDGLEALLLGRTGANPIDDVAETPWYASLSADSAFDAIDDIAGRVAAADPKTWPVDDLTMIAISATM